jgi:hypothetical protein
VRAAGGGAQAAPVHLSPRRGRLSHPGQAPQRADRPRLRGLCQGEDPPHTRDQAAGRHAQAGRGYSQVFKGILYRSYDHLETNILVRLSL